jgi:NitT/TauT family transport system substrate-binding protein
MHARVKPAHDKGGTMRRRSFLKLACAASLSSGWKATAPALTQSTMVTAGYVHALAVDGQLSLATSMGLWKSQNLQMQFIEFRNGIEAFQAMVAGSLDILVTGAVISHYPAMGRGKVFLINDIEYATAQLWVHPNMGIEKVGDLKGKKVTTTTGTTAHVFLQTALRSNGVNPGDVLIINQRIHDAVASFISRAVPAIALWVPHNNLIREKAPGAKMLVDASAYYPVSAVVNGWAARNGFHAAQRDVLARVIRAWAEANDFMVTQPDQALALLRERHYPAIPMVELRDEFNAEKLFLSREWRRMYLDGTVVNWLQQVSDFYVSFASIEKPVPAMQYFDPSIFVDTLPA